jgi:hypothetical protein
MMDELLIWCPSQTGHSPHLRLRPHLESTHQCLPPLSPVQCGIMGVDITAAEVKQVFGVSLGGKQDDESVETFRI